MSKRQTTSRTFLTDHEALVLAAVQQSANETTEVIAKQIGLTPTRVRYLLQHLTERGVILGKTAFLDLSPLGYSYQAIAFSLSPDRHADTKKILHYLIQLPEIIFLGAVAGEYQFYITVCGRSPTVAHDLLREASAKYGCFLMQKAMGSHVKFVSYGRRGLTNKKIPVPELSYQSSHTPSIEASTIDLTLMELLSRDATLSIRDLAQKLKVPATTVHRHLSFLKNKDIWRGTVYRIDPFSINAYQYKFLFYCKSVTAESSKRLALFCKSSPFVVRLIECSGAWDYEVDIEVPNPELVADLQLNLAQSFGEYLQQVRVVQMLRHMKFQPFPKA